MGEVLEDIGSVLEATSGRNWTTAEYLIKNDDVVGWTCCTLESSVSLQVVVPHTSISDTTVNNSAILGVARPDISDLVIVDSGVEASVVALANDDERHAWKALLLGSGRIGLIASLTHRRNLDVAAEVVLTLRDTIAVDQDVLRELTVVVLLPQSEARLEKLGKVGYHLFATFLNRQLGRELREVLINTSDDSSDGRSLVSRTRRRVGNI